MTAYRCRFTAPYTSEWSTIEADSPELAANKFHDRHTGSNYSADSITYTPDPDRAERIHFARVEVEGYDSWISRIYTSGIMRRGGIRIRSPITLTDVARAVGWTGNPEDLISEGWDREESEWR